MNQSKLTDLSVENILSTGVSMKMQITDSISENLTNSDLESNQWNIYVAILWKGLKTCVDLTGKSWFLLISSRKYNSRLLNIDYIYYNILYII